MRHLFGTDGIRGVAGEYPLDPDTLRALGRALVASGFRRIVLGRDTRASGPQIEEDLRSGIAEGGGAAESVGVITTPGVSFLCRTQGFDAGIVISASHNPFADNGIKVFASDGLKLSDQQEVRLEARVRQNGRPRIEQARRQEPARDDISWFDREPAGRYMDFLTGTFGPASLGGMKLALDCANGAAFALAPEVFERLGAELVIRADQPDGTNINSNCGAMHPEPLARLVREEGAEAGFAFDGDADRLILVDEQGSVRDGDYALYVLGRRLAEQGLLPSGVVVSTVMANVGLEVALRNLGLELLRTRVGDRYVLEAMQEGGHELGGEQSGHTILRRYSVAGDGILTALQVLAVMVRTEQPLSILCRGLEKFPQVLLNVKVRSKPDFSRIPSLEEEIEGVRRQLGETGRVVIRYSGTEPLARIMIEGQETAAIEALARRIARRFEAELGVE